VSPLCLTRQTMRDLLAWTEFFRLVNYGLPIYRMVEVARRGRTLGVHRNVYCNIRVDNVGHHTFRRVEATVCKGEEGQ
jgi:hypothetical protein